MYFFDPFDITVALSANCDYMQSEMWKVLNMLTNNSQFPQQAVNDSKTISLWTFPLTQYLAHMCEAC